MLRRRLAARARQVAQATPATPPAAAAPAPKRPAAKKAVTKKAAPVTKKKARR